MGFLFRVSSCVVPTAEIRDQSHRMVPRAFTVHCAALVSSPVLGIKHSDQSHLRENRFVMAHGLRVQSIMVGKPGQRDHEAAGHITSTVGKQTAMTDTTQLGSPLIPSTPDPSQGMVPPMGGCMSSPQLTQGTLFCIYSEAHLPEDSRSCQGDSHHINPDSPNSFLF